MGTLGHQGIFVIAVYFFLLILMHFRLPAFQANIMADYKARQSELKASICNIKKSVNYDSALIKFKSTLQF